MLKNYKYRQQDAAELVALLPDLVNHTPTYADPVLFTDTITTLEIVLTYDDACKDDLDTAMTLLDRGPWVYVGEVP